MDRPQKLLRELSRARKRVTAVLKKGPYFGVDELMPKIHAFMDAYGKFQKYSDLMTAYAREHGDEEFDERDDLDRLLSDMDLSQIRGDHTASEWLESVADMVDGRGEWVRMLRQALPDAVKLAENAVGVPDQADHALLEQSREFLDVCPPEKIDAASRSMEEDEHRCVECAVEVRRAASDLADRCAQGLVERRRRPR
jgi:hypothetical protein